MSSASLGSVEPVHPLQFSGACLAANRLEFHYRLEGAGCIRSARLVGQGVEVALTTTTSGLLHAPVPSVAGHFVLWVEAVSGTPAGAPPLPWQTRFVLKKSELADYLAAQPLCASIDLPGGVIFTIDRLLRYERSSILFWSASTGGPGHAVDGDFGGDLLEGHEHRFCTTSNYGHRQKDKHLEQVPSGKSASAMKIQVNAVEHVLLEGGQPLVWCGPHGILQLADHWCSDLSVPAGRPAVLKQDEDFQLGGLYVRLEEVWLGRRQTQLHFGGDIEGVNLLEALSLEDDLGHIYRPIPDIWEMATRQYTFGPIPPKVGRLRVRCQGAGLRLHGQWQIPLEPGARGFAT